MTPPPSLQELIDVVRADAAGADPLSQLAQASQTVAELEEVGDAVLGHFVDQCRRSGRSWSEISNALGVSKQAAHKRFSAVAPTFERFTPRARLVLRAAAEQARALGHEHIDPEHLLLGMFEPSAALAAQVLAEAGITRQGCTEQVIALVPRGASDSQELPGFSQEGIDALRFATEEALRFGHNYIGTEHLLLALYRNPGDVAARVLLTLGLAEDQARAALTEKLATLT
jgi:hypothetical protein